MEILWAPHAEEQLNEIILGIAEKQTVEIALEWEAKIRETVSNLEEFPQIGENIPEESFLMRLDDIDKLRQIICRPFRIVYELTDVACYILSIRHTRMLLRLGDTQWET